MFKSHYFYRHQDTLDIDIYILDILSTGSFVIEYWNRNRMFIGQDVVYIRPKDYWKWKEV